MLETNNVFISWSGERSKKAAEALYGWLPVVLQNAKPWMSSADIQKGTRGLDELGKALDGIKIGIVCLTPENLEAEWILFEAGALSKAVNANAKASVRVCTYLLGGLEPKDVKPPLGIFQATKPDKADTRKLVHTINEALDAPLLNSVLDIAFDGQWPRLEEKLSALPNSAGIRPLARPLEDMVAEILEHARAEAMRWSVSPPDHGPYD